MLSKKTIEFTKDDIETYLKEVAKEYRKRAGKHVHAEIILIGGASVLVNYGFRGTTADIDATIQASSVMKDAINYVGDKHGLPNGWLNQDFKHTSSYSSELARVSVYHREYSNIVTVRTVESEYLIAMKLRSGRNYKNDMSDILGILMSHSKMGNPITIEQIKKATIDLYGSWDTLPKRSQDFIENVMQDGRFDKLYNEIVKSEKDNRELLLQFEQDHPGVIKDSNADNIIDILQERSDMDTIFEQVKQKSKQKNVSTISKGELPHTVKVCGFC